MTQKLPWSFFRVSALPRAPWSAGPPAASSQPLLSSGSCSVSVTSGPGAALEMGASEELLKVVNDVFANSKWSLIKQIFFLPNYSYLIFRDAGSLLKKKK